MSASNSRDKTTLEIGGFGRPMAIVIISAVSAHMITYNLLYNDLSVRHITHIMDGLCHSFYFFYVLCVICSHGTAAVKHKMCLLF